MTIATLLLGSHNAHALTPWADGAPNLTIRLSGAVAQTKAYTEAVTNTLAAPNSLDTFNDVDAVTGSVGSNWTAHYFTGNSNLGSGLAGKKILLLRRTRGGSGYGVVPLIGNIPLEHLNIAGLPASAWSADGSKAWKQTISAENADTYLTKKASDGGVIAVDPNILLKPGTENYPDQQIELTTGAPETKWPLNLTKLDTTGNNGFTVKPTAGLVYGVAVTQDLYEVLQAAQKRTQTLSSDVVIGAYSEKDMPSLSRTLIASLLAGKIGAWDQIKIVDKTDGDAVKSLLDSDILGDAGVSAPYQEATSGSNLTPVALGLRNNGAATSVLAYSVFLNYPGMANAVPPAAKTAHSAVEEDAALPIVKQPIIISDTGALLNDWQNGTNILGFNNVADGAGYAKRWGIAINTADKNTSVTAAGSGGDPWRYIRIDGYAPTLENVAAGVYPYWSEGVVLYRSSKPSDAQWALKTRLMKALADSLGSPAVAGVVSTTQAWGKTGTFATTTDPRGFSTSIPFNSSSPVVPFSHRSGGVLHTEIVPVADSGATGGLQVQLK
ncbi:MAG: hypothetical protein EPN21_10340 [Methylococcaceae bacterium]|nr:MAG: hypothetical protein EPN21_10340 [Methylococcaceae bacterium]